MDFGEKIKELREAKGMTQQNLADLLFVTRQTVSRWEGGSRYPDLVTAKNLADILETTIDTLMADDRAMHIEQRSKAYGRVAGKIERSNARIGYSDKLQKLILAYVHRSNA